MRIAVDLSPGSNYQRKLLCGITSFFHGKPEVELWLPHSNVMNQGRPKAIAGIMGLRPERTSLLTDLYSGVVPCVYMDQQVSPEDVQVCVDHDAVCRLAFDHFRSCNLHSFAFLYPRGHYGAMWREKAFSEFCLQAGYPMHALMMNGYVVLEEEEQFRQMVLDIPKPVGVLLPGDDCGPSFVDYCHELGLRIPEDMQILGIDNQVDKCTACDPQLSSIDVNAERIGTVAAERIYALIRGDDVPTVTKIAPDRLVQRESTSIRTGLSTDVIKVLDFMHANLAQDIEMGDVLAEQILSRRTLENLFKKDVGDAPMKHLRTLRLQRIEHMLKTTELSIVGIGRRCGIPNPVYLNRLFHRFHGCTPREFRQRSGLRLPRPALDLQG